MSNTWLLDRFSSQLLPLHYLGCPKNAIKHYTQYPKKKPTLSAHKKDCHLCVHYQTKAVVFARNWPGCSSQGHLSQDHGHGHDHDRGHHVISSDHNDSHMIIIIFTHLEGLLLILDGPNEISYMIIIMIIIIWSSLSSYDHHDSQIIIRIILPPWSTPPHFGRPQWNDNDQGPSQNRLLPSPTSDGSWS